MPAIGENDNDGEMKWYQQKFRKVIESFITYTSKVKWIVVVDINNAV